jgi:hypothetical protein
MQGQIEPFENAAKEYCSWAEGDPASEWEEGQTAVRLLAAVLHHVMALPGGEVEPLPDHEILLKGPQTEAIYRRFGALPFQYYADVFHPTRIPPEDPDVGNLADDLMDVYADLKQGLAYAASGHPRHAAFHWRFTFGVHWGRHAVSALRALHCHLTDPGVAKERPRGLTRG